MRKLPPQENFHIYSIFKNLTLGFVEGLIDVHSEVSSEAYFRESK